MSGAALAELAGLEARMKGAFCIHFVSVRPGQTCNCRGYVKSVYYG